MKVLQAQRADLLADQGRVHRKLLDQWIGSRESPQK